jgi:microcystin-dependent protein
MMKGDNMEATSLPPGVIVLWSGSSRSIPSGWALCDGSNGTPDLRDKFIVGAGKNYSSGEEGGNENIVLTVEQLPSHTHPLTIQPHNHTTDYLNPVIHGLFQQASFPAMTFMHTHKNKSTDDTTVQGSIAPTGGGQSINILPPYYALCFIMLLNKE